MYSKHQARRTLHCYSQEKAATDTFCVSQSDITEVPPLPSLPQAPATTEAPADRPCGARTLPPPPLHLLPPPPPSSPSPTPPPPILSPVSPKLGGESGCAAGQPRLPHQGGGGRRTTGRTQDYPLQHCRGEDSTYWTITLQHCRGWMEQRGNTITSLALQEDGLNSGRLSNYPPSNTAGTSVRKRDTQTS